MGGSTRLGGPVHGIVTKLVRQNSAKGCGAPRRLGEGVTIRIGVSFDRPVTLAAPFAIHIEW